MSSSRLLRLSGLAAVIGGVFIILPRVFQVSLFGDQPLSVQAVSDLFVPLVGIPGLIGSICFLFGAVGLYAAQAQKTGILGLIVFIFTFTGIALSLGANWTYGFASPILGQLSPELLNADFGDPGWGALGTGLSVSYLSGGIGWLLMGILTLFSGVFPRWVGLTMITGLLAAAFVPLEIVGFQGIIVNILLSLGPIAFGLALWFELYDIRKRKS